MGEMVIMSQFDWSYYYKDTDNEYNNLFIKVRHIIRKFVFVFPLKAIIK